MKRACLTVFFAFYVIFMPFVYVNCSVADTPYVIGDDSESDAELLAECQTMEFVTADCVDILQAEEDRIAASESAVASALINIEDFEACKSEADISALIKFQTTDEEAADETTTDGEDPYSETATDETTEEDTLDCETVINAMISAYQVCEELSTSEKYYDCDDIEDAMNEAVQACDDGSSDVSQDFCSTLTA